MQIVASSDEMRGNEKLSFHVIQLISVLSGVLVWVWGPH